MSEVILAVLAPFLMVIFLTRITFNQYVSAILTLGIILAIFKGYEQPNLVIIAWVLSLVVGFFVSNRMNKKFNKKY
ncbi:DUF2198 family protein [Bacillus sp. Marseille-P3661]|uniref:DUF2198 family protein n=1 Tax=Bacillus sp. Marseille-P3661 TaxID=1936234 RepID=UPI000C83895D|nr:DUF2198 family protein [Bacillus sp. Marseille-P3661]